MRLSGLRYSRLPSSIKSIPAATDVFTNSLRKTLEAHRSTNRARLIRKIIPADDPAGLWRPVILPKIQPLPVDAPLSKSRKKRKNLVPPTRKAVQSTQIQWPPSHWPPSPWPSNPESTLDTEIRALERHLIPSSSANHGMLKIEAEIASLLATVVPHAPKIIGSHCTGLAMRHSALDFLLPYEDTARSLNRDRRPSPTRPQIRGAHLRLLRQVERVLRDTDTFTTIGLQRSTISARHRPSGLLLHFYCGEGMPAITEHLQDYQAEYPALRPLYAVTRTLLEARGLFGSSHAGVGPDALAMLIVAFLKLNHGRFLGPKDLGDQLLAFLQFYGSQINIQSVGIAVDPPGLFSASTIPVTSHADEPAHLRGQRSLISAKRSAAKRGNSLVAQRLCVQDPTHYMNDLGRSCTRTPELQNAFADAYRSLRRTCDEWADKQKSSILATALQHTRAD